MGVSKVTTLNTDSMYLKLICMTLKKYQDPLLSSALYSLSQKALNLLNGARITKNSLLKMSLLVDAINVAEGEAKVNVPSVTAKEEQTEAMPCEEVATEGQ